MRLILNILLIFTGCIFAQPGKTYTSTNKKAIKFYEEGLKFYQSYQHEKALAELQKCIKEDAAFIEAYLAMGQLLAEKNKLSDAENAYKKAIEINPNFFPRAFYELGLVQFYLMKYDDAEKNIRSYLKQPKVNPEIKPEAERYLANCSFASEQMKKPKKFNPVNLGSGINTVMDEYFPSVTADGREFLFTRAIPYKEYPDIKNEDFFISEKMNGKWNDALPIREINSQGNEGAPSLSADGNILFFASCATPYGDYGSPERKGFGSCDIFYSVKVNGRWSKPKNAGPKINSQHWETQPSFSSDGKTLYFIRGLLVRGEIKQQDIYMSTVDENGQFTEAIKLSDVVNTPYKEESVFIHPDNQTLYFSSEGHKGMGGLDIFMSRKNPDGTWSEPVNLGYPINTSSDENSLLVGPDGKIAFFASNRPGGYGGLDIYGFELNEDIRPQSITYIKGKVIDAATNKPLQAFVRTALAGQIAYERELMTNGTGDFMMVLNGNKKYVFHSECEGYMFFSESFDIPENASIENPFVVKIPMIPIDTGNSIILKNIFFDVNKWDLKPESKTELNKLIDFLKKNPSVKIEISGHTDNSGDRKNNLTLSLNRAKAVYDYLIQEGKISSSRLTYKGYADLKPRVPNTSPENKAINRRTEYKIISK
jgi:outer membrane protein OmpA-like peptidoglycan-associated protein/tetratricopeptide (TPR) repeat protein